MRHLLLTLAVALCAQAAHAAQAGKVIFVAGKAQMADRAATEGAPVQEGELLSTGADGFIYVKTVDNGLFILRPNTKARIVAYHVDAKDPKNTRIKLELLSGVARSRSGDAVKLARQNFRFNTPVAAIGVRGTDFTVFTDENTSRVAVLSGGIVMSGFEGACRPEGTGPCEGNASRELSAAQRGQLLQIQRGQTAPLLMQGGALGPDQMAPPRGDEPIGKNSGVNSSSNLVSAEPTLDVQKSANLNQITNNRPPITQQPPPVTITPPPEFETGTPPVVTVPDVPVVPAVPERLIVWGRWQPLLGSAPALDFEAEKSRSELLAVKGNFALFRAPGSTYTAPVGGNIGFALNSSEAYVYTERATGRTVTQATLSNGTLNIDFGKKTFATAMDLLSGTQVYRLQGQGAIGIDGRMYGDSALGRPNFISVEGALSSANGGSAAYIFDGRLDTTRTVNGVTFWK
jgi:hypothetical protein